jgi:Protein of unknown function (DUF3579)
MSPAATKPRELFIQGLTLSGQVFRPSDWAERLAGVMSCFRDDGITGEAAALSYSPYCVPTLIDGVKCVVVNEAIKNIEPKAWDFALDFAKSNELRVIDACLLPDLDEPQS